MSKKEFIYEDVLKQEFRDSLLRMLQSRRHHFHVYAIDRVCTQGALVGFDYRYYPCDESSHYVLKGLDLGSYGKLTWRIDCSTGYGSLLPESGLEVISKFLDHFSIISHSKI